MLLGVGPGERKLEQLFNLLKSDSGIERSVILPLPDMYLKVSTVFPRIVSAETILLLI